MARYPDLTPFHDFGPELGACLQAVGCLERGQLFPTGSVAPAVYARLLELLRNPWEPAITLGFHRCNLCLYDGVPGKRNLYVPAGGQVFVSPELITHYMNAHAYQPPEEFCRAVLACPAMRSMTYLKALVADARPLVQFGKG